MSTGAHFTSKSAFSKLLVLSTNLQSKNLHSISLSKRWTQSEVEVNLNARCTVTLNSVHTDQASSQSMVVSCIVFSYAVSYMIAG